MELKFTLKGALRLSIILIFMGCVVQEALSQEIQVRGRDGILPWVDISDGDTTPRDADGTDFDTHNTVGGSNNNPFQIRNRDGSTLTISSITVSPSTHYTVTNIPTSVPGNSNRTFNITFDPTSAGTKNATVTIINNDPDGGEGTFTFAITGIGVDNSPEIKLQGRDGSLPWTEIVDGDTTPRDADGTDFDTHDVIGGSNTNPFRIQNLGGTVLNISSITDNSTHFSVSSIPNNVDPGQNETFNVTFNPTTAGTKTATITIINNDPDGGESTFTFRVTGIGRDNQQEINIRGRDGILPWVSIIDGDNSPRDADGTDFDIHDVSGGLNDNPFQIQNSGDQTLAISSISVSNGSNFSIVGSTPSSVAPNSNQQFIVRFNPSSIGVHTAVVTINNNDPDGNENIYTFSVRGEGRDNLQEIEVQGRDGVLPYVEIIDGDNTPRDADGTDFDGRNVSGASNSNTFRIRNLGDATLVINSISVSNPSNYNISSIPTSVAGNSNATFTVTFNPSTIGTQNAVVTINNNDPDGGENIFTFAITGVGLDNLQEIKVQGRDGILPWVEINNNDTSPRDADGTDFDNHNVTGGSNTNPFRIINEGNAPLAISSIELDDDTHFTLTNIPTSVPANDSRIFNVTFDPTSIGSKTTNINIINDDPDGDEDKYTYTITGVGVDNTPEIQIRGRDGLLPWNEIVDGDTTPRDADGTDFDNRDVIGGSNTNPFQIRNLGDAVLNVAKVSISPETHFTISSQPDGSVSSGKSTTFEVTFNPASSGTHNAVVTVESDDPTGDEDTYTFTVTGNGIDNQPEIEIQGRDGILPWTSISDGDTSPRDADGTDFDSHDVFGGSNNNPFRIRNTGDATLNISSITVSNGSNFSIVGSTPTSIPAGSNETFTIRFDPNSIGTQNATVTINNNDPDSEESVYTFLITGVGLDNLQEIKVQGRDGVLAWTEINDGDSNPRDADGTDFDNRNVIGAQNDNPFRILNEGDVTLNISSISVSNGSNFSVIGTMPTSVAPNSAETFTVRFNPSSAGIKNAQVTINNNDPDGGENTFTFAVTGIGIDNEQEIKVQGRDGILPWTEITDADTTPRDADGTDFDTHNIVGGSNTNPFRIRNLGDAPLLITSITVSPSTHFSLSSIPSSVAANGSEIFEIIFDPTSVGIHTATVTINNNDPDGNEDVFTFRIVGEGIENQPEIKLQGRNGILPWVEIGDGSNTPRDADGTDFDNRNVLNGSNTNQFRIHNTGNANLVISSITVSPNSDFTVANVPVNVTTFGFFDIIFDPTSPGIKNATVTIINNDPTGGESTFTFDITGVGLAEDPDIFIQGRDGILPWTMIQDGDTTPRDADGTDFDRRAEVGGANTNPFRIRNTGNQTLVISSITVSPSTDFVITDIPDVVAANSNSIFRVTFNPSSVGTKNATVTILSNDPAPGQSSYTFAIVGIGESSNIPDSDGDGVNDNVDVCQGFDDNVDVNANGIPDGCDDSCPQSLSLTSTIDGSSIQNYIAELQVELNSVVASPAAILLSADVIQMEPGAQIDNGAQLTVTNTGCSSGN